MVEWDLRLDTWLDTRLDNRVNTKPTCTIIDHGTIFWVNIIWYILLNLKSKLYSLNLWNKLSWPMSVSFHIGRIPHVEMAKTCFWLTQYLDERQFHFSISREVNIPLFTDNINLPQSGFTLVWAQVPQEPQKRKIFYVIWFYPIGTNWKPQVGKYSS